MKHSKLSYNSVTQNNFQLTPEMCDDHSRQLPSLTIQGESFSVKDLVQKMANGQLPQIMRQGFYANPENFDAPDFEKVATLDLIDQQILLNNNQQKILEITQELQKKPEATKVEPEKKTDEKPVDKSLEG